MKAIDLTGQVFGRLTVASMEFGGARGSMAVCLCACGASKSVLAYNLRSGNTSSCGCANREAAASRGKVVAPILGAQNRTHGHTTRHVSTPTYASWSDAKKRCYSPQNKRFADYGGRGIKMCERWRDSFEAFLADMGEKPHGKTLDRFPNKDGDYEPANCRWATATEQAQNQRSNVGSAQIAAAIRYRRAAGESVASLAAEFGMSMSNVDMIARRLTWKE